ncbi:cellulose binding domain-containing protein, partial [Candidatus Saccharibacteria bacterium]|nr:cellulose binding domain-containing protein [Candidatus Saccharibacteria bacterium]
MLRYRRKRSNTLKRAMTLLAIPLVLTSTGYALFSQDLTVDGNVTKPAYSRSQSLLMTYDKVVTVFNQNRWEYNLTITIENQGTSNVNSWHLTFDLPSNNTGFRCFDDTVCVENNGAVTIDNGTSTAIITAGNSVSFTMRFRLTTDTYSLQNIDISGTYAPTYQTISGLTASHVLG